LTHVGTSARLLKLLSLLARRGWSGDGLAARLEVTERTVRRAWWSRAAGRTTGTVRGRLGTWQLSFHGAMLVCSGS
jgi:predicted DNA-binding transcriptional regulator YafY